MTDTGDTGPAPADEQDYPEAGADLAAELDDEPDPEVLAAEAAADDDAPPVYVGVCHDGPWDGLTLSTRYPKGFLLVDKPGAQVWIYDRNDTDGGFYARTPDPQALLEDGPVNRWRAAEEPNYDILALDAEVAPAADDGPFDDGTFDAPGGGY